VHAGSERDILIPGDKKGFIRDGRRERLEATFGIRIMTPAEFVADFAS
jgi:hypothetical protein